MAAENRKGTDRTKRGWGRKWKAAPGHGPSLPSPVQP